MSAGPSPDFKELVRARTNLVELVGENVALKALRGGADHTGLCPFHDDHNASFHVYPDRQTYRCWSCNEGGDCFSYVMKYEAVEFREALELLAKRAGLEVPKQNPRRDGFGGNGANGSDASSQSSSVPSGIGKPELFEVLTWAEGLFHESLKRSPSAEEARAYLLGRGFTDETIDRFKLGYHPNDWEWLVQRAKGRFAPELLAAARLVKEREGGRGYVDYFVDRVIFPIHDERGRTVAFGGRVLPGHENGQSMKYFNSADSPVFHKSRLVFGLHAARDTIRKSEPATAVLVEGYADCIKCHQHGVTNVVGTLGTALADSHVEVLKRFAKRVVLVFDGDKAGRDAAERALGKFIAHDVDLRVLTIPDGSKDPDEFLQNHGADAFRELVKQATDVLSYKLAACIARHGLETAGGREAVLQEMLELLAESRTLQSNSREDRILQWLSQRLLTKEETLRQTLQKVRQDRARRAPARGMHKENNGAAPRQIEFLSGKRSRHDLIESELLEILFTEPQWTDEIRRHVSVTDFQNEHLRDLAQACYDVAEQGDVPSLERLLSTLEDPALKQLAVKIDEMARQKGVAELLQQHKSQSAGIRVAGPSTGTLWSQTPHPEHHDPTHCPQFLQQAMHNITWRRQEQRHVQPRMQVAQFNGAAVSGSSGGLDPQALALLQRVQDHNGRRAGRHGASNAPTQNSRPAPDAG